MKITHQEHFLRLCLRHDALAQIISIALIISFALLIVPPPCVAQQVTAAVTGQVTDPSGGALAGAKITITDTERGTVWPTSTNEEGAYNLPRIPVGIYNVRVEATGFQAATQSNITLVMNQVARLDFQLQLGSMTQTVEVSSAPPLLQTQATQLGQVIDSRTNTELPLATRNYVQLTLLTAGSVHPDPSAFKSGQTTANSGRPYVNGNREQSNNFILDGIDNNQVSDNYVGYSPSVDAIQEFNEITQNAPAEFGNYMGAIISTSIKAGTNGFHGDAFEFFRNDKLNANDWANNFKGASRSAIRWNNFGGTFGGPIKKDKLFFFADYQGQRLDTPTSTTTTTVYTAAERQGDFSQLLSQAKPIQLYNPFSRNSAGNRMPFPGNIIPASMFSPAASKILTSQYYPEPTNGNLLNNYLYSSQSAINGNQGDIRVDWNRSESDRIFGRYSQSGIDTPSTNTFPLSYNGFGSYPTRNAVADYTHTFGPSLVNEARVGMNYVLVNGGPAANGLSNFAQTVGIPGVPSAFLPSMTLSGGNVASFGTSDVYQLIADTVIQYEDTLIWTKGKHLMRFGFQGFRDRINTFYPGNSGRAGIFSFNGQYTAGPVPGTAAGGASGLAEADFLLGLPSDIQGGINGGTWGQRSNVFGAFFQDDWRVTPNLTLNLGLRWELHTPWGEVENRQANFNLVSGAEEIAGQNGNSSALYNQYNGITNFQPRIGFAYTPGGGRLVFRGAYTLSSYLEGTGTNLRLPLNPPFATEHENNYTLSPYQALPGSTLDEGFLPFASNTGDQYHGVNLRVWDPNVRPAVANQWNFTVQDQINANTTLQVGYVGQRTTHLMVPMPYYQKVLNSDGSVSPSQFLAGNPTLMSDIGNISGTNTNGNQSYNSLQVVLQKHMSSGLQYSVAYTYSKCMSDAIGYYGASGQSGSQSAYWQNIYNAQSEWGPCYYDVTHNFTANAVYDVPFGRDRMFGKNLNKMENAVLGDWQVSGILSLHTGFPLTVSATDVSGTGSRGSRANCVAPGNVLGTQSSPENGYLWFDPSAYAQPGAGTFGNCGVGTIRGPGLHTFDFDLSKNFPVTEHQHLELRAEFINLTNTPILNAPNHGVGTTLGLLQTSQGARNIQFALKYSF